MCRFAHVCGENNLKKTAGGGGNDSKFVYNIKYSEKKFNVVVKMIYSFITFIIRTKTHTTILLFKK